MQLHSKEYRQPSQIPEGGVLVVGAGNSGAEIAIELARHHRTWLSGPDTGQEPTGAAGSLIDRALTPIMWFMATRVLTVNRFIGRKIRDHYLDPPRGLPLGRVRRKDFAAAGIERVPRVSRVHKNGCPVLEDGRVLEVSSVIWCTGFTPGYHWIDLSLPTRHGVPVHDRGVVQACPGLYFVGLLFLYSLSSSLVGGVGRDAGHIVDHIVSTRVAGREDVPRPERADVRVSAVARHRLAGERGNRGDELRRIDWFRQVDLEARLKSAQAVFRPCVRGQRGRG